MIVENAPLNFVRGGYYHWYAGQLDDIGAHGHYWSSSVYTSTSARRMMFGSDYFNPQYDYLKGIGFSVRCVPQSQAKSL